MQKARTDFCINLQGDRVLLALQTQPLESVVVFPQLPAGQQKHAPATTRKLKPGERHRGTRGNQCTFRIAHFSNEDPLRFQVLCRAHQQSPHHIQSVGTGPQSQIGLAAVFKRQGLHFSSAHIGRIRDDDVIARSAEIRIDVREHWPHSGNDRVSLAVDLCNGQRLGRDVYRVDRCLWQCECSSNGNASRSCTDVGEPAHLFRVHPRSEARFNQFCNRRTRHQDPLIDMELVPGKPHPLRQVGRRDALLDPTLQQPADGRPLSVIEDFGVDPGGILVLELGCIKDQLCSIIHRAVSAMTETEVGSLQQGCAGANELFDCLRCVDHGLRAAVCWDNSDTLQDAAPCHNCATMNKSTQIIVGTAVAIVAALAGMLLSRSLVEPAAQTPALKVGTWLDPGRALPEFELVDQGGQPFGKQQLEGRWHLLFFGFTSCPDICPTTLTMLGTLEQSLKDLPAEQRPGIVFVSVDPQRDTPERVAAYVKFFSPQFTGITGTTESIKKFADAMHVPYAISPLADGSYTVDHSSALFLVGPGAQLRAIFSAPHDAAALNEDFRRIASLTPTTS